MALSCSQTQRNFGRWSTTNEKKGVNLMLTACVLLSLWIPTAHANVNGWNTQKISGIHGPVGSRKKSVGCGDGEHVYALSVTNAKNLNSTCVAREQVLNILSSVVGNETVDNCTGYIARQVFLSWSNGGELASVSLGCYTYTSFGARTRKIDILPSGGAARREETHMCASGFGLCGFEYSHNAAGNINGWSTLCCPWSAQRTGVTAARPAKVLRIITRVNNGGIRFNLTTNAMVDESCRDWNGTSNGFTIESKDDVEFIVSAWNALKPQFKSGVAGQPLIKVQSMSHAINKCFLPNGMMFTDYSLGDSRCPNWASRILAWNVIQKRLVVVCLGRGSPHQNTVVDFSLCKVTVPHRPRFRPIVPSHLAPRFNQCVTLQQSFIGYFGRFMTSSTPFGGFNARFGQISGPYENNLATQACSVKECWIGAMLQEGNSYAWADGSLALWTNFLQDQPSQQNIVAQPRCVSIVGRGYTNSGKWLKRDCGDSSVQVVLCGYPDETTTGSPGQTNRDACNPSVGVIGSRLSSHEAAGQQLSVVVGGCHGNAKNVANATALSFSIQTPSGGTGWMHVTNVTWLDRTRGVARYDLSTKQNLKAADVMSMKVEVNVITRPDVFVCLNRLDLHIGSTSEVSFGHYFKSGGRAFNLDCTGSQVYGVDEAGKKYVTCARERLFWVKRVTDQMTNGKGVSSYRIDLTSCGLSSFNAPTDVSRQLQISLTGSKRTKIGDADSNATRTTFVSLDKPFDLSGISRTWMAGETLTFMLDTPMGLWNDLSVVTLSYPSQEYEVFFRIKFASAGSRQDMSTVEGLEEEFDVYMGVVGSHPSSYTRQKLSSFNYGSELEVSFRGNLGRIQRVGFEVSRKRGTLVSEFALIEGLSMRFGTDTGFTDISPILSHDLGAGGGVVGPIGQRKQSGEFVKYYAMPSHDDILFKKTGKVMGAFCVSNLAVNSVERSLTGNSLGGCKGCNLRAVAYLQMPICSVKIENCLWTKTKEKVTTSRRVPPAGTGVDCKNKNRFLYGSCDVNHAITVSVANSVTTDVTASNTKSTSNGRGDSRTGQTHSIGVNVGLSAGKRGTVPSGVEWLVSGGAQWSMQFPSETQSVSFDSTHTTMTSRSDGTMITNTRDETVSCSGSISVPPQHDMFYTLGLRQTAVEYEQVCDHRLVLCKDMAVNGANPETIVVPNVPVHTRVVDTPTCVIEFEPSNQPLKNRLKCKDERQEAWLLGSQFYPECDEMDVDKYAPCQCVDSTAYSNGMCACFTPTGDVALGKGASEIRRGSTMLDTCNRLQCHQEVASIPTVLSQNALSQVGSNTNWSMVPTANTWGVEYATGKNFEKDKTCRLQVKFDGVCTKNCEMVYAIEIDGKTLGMKKNADGIMETSDACGSVMEPGDVMSYVGTPTSKQNLFPFAFPPDNLKHVHKDENIVLGTQFDLIWSPKRNQLLVKVDHNVQHHKKDFIHVDENHCFYDLYEVGAPLGVQEDGVVPKEIKIYMTPVLAEGKVSVTNVVGPHKQCGVAADRMLESLGAVSKMNTGAGAMKNGQVKGEALSVSGEKQQQSVSMLSIVLILLMSILICSVIGGMWIMFQKMKAMDSYRTPGYLESALTMDDGEIQVTTTA